MEFVPQKLEVTFEEIKKHTTHRIAIGQHYDNIGVWNVTIECVDCGEVIVERNNPDLTDARIRNLEKYRI